MKLKIASATTLLILFLSPPANGATRYVWSASPAEAGGSDWATAFHSIQTAIDASAPGDTVLVTNGVYDTGARTAPAGSLLCRLVITNGVRVESVNGPGGCTLVGQGPFGTGAVRCAYVAGGSVLSGFTLTNGWTRMGSPEDPDGNGGGAWIAPGGMITNCLITGNQAFSEGGGIYGGTAIRCTISRNCAVFGGGAYGTTVSISRVNSNSAMFGGGLCSATAINSLVSGNSATNYGGGFLNSSALNCTIADNCAFTGGGCCESTVTNSIVLGNFATNAPNVYGGSCEYTCTTPFLPGIGNVNSSYALFAGNGNYRLQQGSPCIDAGLNISAAGGVDLDGNARTLDGNADGAATVDIGCYEFTNTHSATAVWYVWTNSPANGPGTNWNTAFHDIQSGIDAALAGDLVLVTNGTYSTGGRTVQGDSQTNRIVAQRPITIRSVNGNGSTIIAGKGPVGSAAIRCAYLQYGAVLSGFTLSNGFVSTSGSGGGAYISYDSVLTNCIIRNSSAGHQGGGVFADASSWLRQCQLTSNTCFAASEIGYGGAVYGGRLDRCSITLNSAGVGAGASDSTLIGCSISNNSAIHPYIQSQLCSGGGINSGSAANCLIVNNSAKTFGGGAMNASLTNCTVAGNSANLGGGTHYSSVVNSIIYSNSSLTDTGYPNCRYGSVAYSCTTPDPGGSGNITNSPAFAATGNYHLQSTSPCIDTGVNTSAATTGDLDGSNRIRDGNADGTATVDMGCYEYVPLPPADSDGDGMPDAWEILYGLNPDNPSDAALDADADGRSNLQEYLAGTDPRNSLSVLSINRLSTGNGQTGMILSWPSTSGRYYRVDSSTNLMLGFPDLISNNIAATPATNSIELPQASTSLRFYRVALE